MNSRFELTTLNCARYIFLLPRKSRWRQRQCACTSSWMVGQKHSWSMISEASWRLNAINVIFVKFLPIYRSDREVKASVRENLFSARFVVLVSVFRCMQNLLIAVSPRGFFTALDTKEFREVLRASFR